MNTIKLLQKIAYLKEGKTLRLVHECYNVDILVRMNPQKKNRIFIEEDNIGTLGSDFTEQKMNYLLMWDCGEWYLVEEEPTEKYVKVVTVGKYKLI